jgi:hypothetical protein
MTPVVHSSSGMNSEEMTASRDLGPVHGRRNSSFCECHHLESRRRAGLIQGSLWAPHACSLDLTRNEVRSINMDL